jgi:hypothetical protein
MLALGAGLVVLRRHGTDAQIEPRARRLLLRGPGTLSGTWNALPTLTRKCGTKWPRERAPRSSNGHWLASPASASLPWSCCDLAWVSLAFGVIIFVAGWEAFGAGSHGQNRAEFLVEPLDRGGSYCRGFAATCRGEAPPLCRRVPLVPRWLVPRLVSPAAVLGQAGGGRRAAAMPDEPALFDLQLTARRNFLIRYRSAT